MTTRHHVRFRGEEQWPPPVLRGLRVLVVEDDADEREITAALLGAAGADVRSAGTAADALATLAWWWPDVLLSDIGLPGGDGYQLLEAVRSTPRGRGLPAAAVTGQTGADDRRRALRAGFRAHLPKPVDPDRLVSVVAGIADPARAAVERFR
jgi:CheY-like chemotaxis protein